MGSKYVYKKKNRLNKQMHTMSNCPTLDILLAAGPAAGLAAASAGLATASQARLFCDMAKREKMSTQQLRRSPTKTALRWLGN